MGNSNKNVVKAARKNMVSTSAPDEETFDFPALPYVCQKRFAEILDPKTLKTFAAINSTTKNLAKRCHIIEKAKIEIDEKLSKCKYILSCFCNETEFCRGVHESCLSSMKKKSDVHTMIWILNENVKIDARFLQSLPFTFNSNKMLAITVQCIKLDDLKMIMHPGLKVLSFGGGIESQCPMKEFMDFIKSLAQLDVFQFVLVLPFSSLSFNIDDLAFEGAALLSQKVITKFEVNMVSTTLQNFMNLCNYQFLVC